jgi:hypothetical protein
VREFLATLDGQTVTVRATVERFGLRHTSRGDRLTLLLVDVRDMDDRYLAEHMWMSDTLPFQVSGFGIGKVVTFTGEVGPYSRVFDGESDYTIKRVREVSYACVD